MVQQLVDAKASLTAVNTDNHTPLHSLSFSFVWCTWGFPEDLT